MIWPAKPFKTLQKLRRFILYLAIFQFRSVILGAPGMFASQEVPEPIIFIRLLSVNIVVQFRASERLICCESRHLELFGSRPRWQRHSGVL